MSKVVGQDLILKLFRVLNDDLVVVEPCKVVAVLFFLDGSKCT